MRPVERKWREKNERGNMEIEERRRADKGWDNPKKWLSSGFANGTISTGPSKLDPMKRQPKVPSTENESATTFQAEKCTYHLYNIHLKTNTQTIITHTFKYRPIHFSGRHGLGLRYGRGDVVLGAKSHGIGGSTLVWCCWRR